jgi:hypothetical protein
VRSALDRFCLRPDLRKLASNRLFGVGGRDYVMASARRRLKRATRLLLVIARSRPV